MKGIASRAALACLAILLATGSLAQVSENVDSRFYEDFFRQVLVLRDDAPSPSSVTLLNGKPVDGIIFRDTQPDLKQIGLTVEELTTLKTIAASCRDEGARFDQASRVLTFEARMQSMQSNGVSPALSARIGRLAMERQRMVEDHVGKLKIALGDAAFRKLDAYVRAYANCDAVGRSALCMANRAPNRK